jgi:flagellin
VSVNASGNAVTAFLQYYLTKSNWDVERIQKRLLTGYREDDSVRVGLGNQLDVKAVNSLAAIENLNDGISYLNIADGALSGIEDLFTTIRTKIETAAASTDATERTNLNTEVNDLVAQANEIVTSTDFAGRKIFYEESPNLTLKAGEGKSGSFQVTVGKGADLIYSGIDVTLAGNPTNELARLDAFTDKLLIRRGNINAGRSRATAATAYLGIMVGVYEEAASVTGTIDEAEEALALEAATAKQEALTGLLAQHLDSRQSIMSQIYGMIG